MVYVKQDKELRPISLEGVVKILEVNPDIVAIFEDELLLVSGAGRQNMITYPEVLSRDYEYVVVIGVNIDTGEKLYGSVGRYALSDDDISSTSPRVKCSTKDSESYVEFSITGKQIKYRASTDNLKYSGKYSMYLLKNSGIFGGEA